LPTISAKGVRTVQRYEGEAGLPVRRPSARNKGLVFAWPEELDAWISKQSVSTESNSEIELLRLRSTVTRLEAENEVLRHELKLLAVKASGGNSDLDQKVLDGSHMVPLRNPACDEQIATAGML
jgi:hypothetical protein